MKEILGKIKDFGKGIVKTFKKIKNMIKFFMTQVRNGRRANNTNFSSSDTCVDNDKNNRKFFGEMV